MARRMSRIPRARKIVNYSWALFNVAAERTIAAGAVDFVGTLVPTIAADLTIVRVRGFLAVQSDQAVAVEWQNGAFGMIVVSEEAAAAGAPSMPAPVADADNDGWFMYQPIVQSGTGAAGTRVSFQYDIDSKAQRILQTGGDVIALLVENSHAATGMRIAFQVRVLTRIRS